MASDRELLERILAAQESFGPKRCGKFSGAVTVEVLRAGLRQAGFAVSNRDVFIRGVAIEVDLLLVRPGSDLSGRVLYEPTDVLVALEIKNVGSFGQATIDKVRADFSRISAACPAALCAYVTLAERESYKWAVTEGNLGHPAFTLFWLNHSGRQRHYQSTGDWPRLLGVLQAQVGDNGGPDAQPRV